MTTYSSPATFKFFRGLARNNSREWFHAHKADYEAHVREPFQLLLGDLQPALADVSEHYRSDPAKVSGSLFRIHRDTRFANDKSPYKTWQGAKLFHERSRQVEAPSYHIHIQPGGCFIGAGLWQPASDTLRRLRNFIVDNPASWKAAAHAPKLRKQFDFRDNDKLVRPPRGFPTDFEFIEDLKHRSWVLWRPLKDEIVTGPNLLGAIEADLATLAPFVDYLCAGLDLEF